MIHAIKCENVDGKSGKYMISWNYTDLNNNISINEIEVRDYDIRNTIINKLIEAQISYRVVTKREIRYIRAKR
jgi:hypothetical protein